MTADITVHAALRETPGMIVRDIWIDWAREQPNPKPSWLLPWEQLTEPQQEVDRRIGEVLSDPASLTYRAVQLELARVAAYARDHTGTETATLIRARIKQLKGGR